MLNHKAGHEKNVKIVFIKKSEEAVTVIKKIEIVGVEGEQAEGLPNVGCSECPIVSKYLIYYVLGVYI